jgi:hypothetical protein
MTLGRHAMIAAGVTAFAMLAGCSRSTPDEPPAETNETVQEAPAPVPVPAPSPAPKRAPATSESTPTPPVADEAEPQAGPDAQMLDDADATGMTARVTRDDAAANEVTQH